MRPRTQILCRLLLVSLPVLPACADEDPRLREALYRLSQEASKLWQTAPRFTAVETVTQKALVLRKSKVKVGPGVAAIGAAPAFQNREIVSAYALGAFKGSPEALREFRQIFSVDGAPLSSEDDARARLEEELVKGSNASKEDLIREFEKRCLAGAATDFGQIILLFTRTNIKKYSFEFSGENRLGADNTFLISFKQEGGGQSLHISEGHKKTLEKLQGEIWVRQGDFLPLRVVVNSSRMRDKNEIADEAKVDYTVVSGALLPASFVYRRQVNADVVLESVYRYSTWRPVTER